MSKIISRKTYEKLKIELEKLKTEERKKIAEKIKAAKEFGDLSENSEYQSALEEQKKLERKIFELEQILKSAKIINDKTKSKDTSNKKINIGSSVKLVDLDTKNEFDITIMAFGESNPMEGKITIESPLGKSLLNKKEGDIIEVNIGNNKKKYKIKAVN
jgi:transcription elongation factor GreA